MHTINSNSESLSLQARLIWAKTSPDDFLGLNCWLPLTQHIHDSWTVAQHLWESWLPKMLTDRISADFGNSDLARRIACWLAAIHDIGKATPAFACKVKSLADRNIDSGLEISRITRTRDGQKLPHALASQMILTKWLIHSHGWTKPRAEAIACPVGGHHGMMPDPVTMRAVKHRIDLSGDEAWQSVQKELLDYAGARYLHEQDLEELVDVTVSQACAVLMSSLVIMADWIASNQLLFPTMPIDVLGTIEDDDRVNLAMQILDLPEPWQPTPPAEDRELFNNRFGFDSPHPAQLAAAELAATMDPRGLMIIEAAMGSGKSEAALACAEVLAARVGAGGCLIALPTQATTNAMFNRALEWLEHLDDDSVHVVNLAHGKAYLNDDFSGLIRGGMSMSMGDDLDDADKSLDLQVQAHSWLSGRKKGMLAPFVISTIDQLLFMALKSRHVTLRHLALASKVVIIDEVHAVDLFSMQYLSRAVQWLGAYGVPTIVLSATLPSDKRKELIQSYQQGKFVAAVEAKRRLPSAQRTAEPEYPELDGDIGYPVITVTGPTLGTVEIVTRPVEDRQNTVELLPLDDDETTLVDLLKTQLVDGGCAAVIHNTVTRAQATAKTLMQHFPAEELVVTHSRFLAVERAERDSMLVQKLGRDGQRPNRMIVVATQVVEQSLDIDFDLMITDIAPVDLIMQRLGRLHRHQRGIDQDARPQLMQQARCYIRGAAWSEPVPTIDPGTARVYPRYLLLRSLGVLQQYLTSNRPLRLPNDIPGLVQHAYGNAELADKQLQLAAMEELNTFNRINSRKKNEASVFLIGKASTTRNLIGWQDAGVGEADDEDRLGRAQVRDSGDSLEVLVTVRGRDGLSMPEWTKFGGELIPQDQQPPSWQAKELLQCSLRLPPVMCLPSYIKSVIEDLERNGLPAWQQSPWLREQLVLVLDENYQAQVADFSLSYDPALGLEYSRG